MRPRVRLLDDLVDTLVLEEIRQKHFGVRNAIAESEIRWNIHACCWTLVASIDNMVREKERERERERERDNE